MVALTPYQHQHQHQHQRGIGNRVSDDRALYVQYSQCVMATSGTNDGTSGTNDGTDRSHATTTTTTAGGKDKTPGDFTFVRCVGSGASASVWKSRCCKTIRSAIIVITAGAVTMDRRPVVGPGLLLQGRSV